MTITPLLVLTLLHIIIAAPTNTTTLTNEVNCENPDDLSTYDQRQNGTENVRVNVKDVFLVWAPSQAAPGMLDSDFLDYPNEEVPQKPIGSNEIERPTSIIDILNSFQELAAASVATGKIFALLCAHLFSNYQILLQ